MGPLLATHRELCRSCRLLFVACCSRLDSTPIPRSAMWPGLFSHSPGPPDSPTAPSLFGERPVFHRRPAGRARSRRRNGLSASDTDWVEARRSHPSAVRLLAYRLFVLSCPAPPTLTTRRVGSERATPCAALATLLPYLSSVRETGPYRTTSHCHAVSGLEPLAGPFLFSSFSYSSLSYLSFPGRKVSTRSRDWRE